MANKAEINVSFTSASAAACSQELTPSLASLPSALPRKHLHCQARAFTSCCSSNASNSCLDSPLPPARAALLRCCRTRYLSQDVDTAPAPSPWCPPAQPRPALSHPRWSVRGLFIFSPLYFLKQAEVPHRETSAGGEQETHVFPSCKRWCDDV